MAQRKSNSRLGGTRIYPQLFSVSLPSSPSHFQSTSVEKSKRNDCVHDLKSPLDFVNKTNHEEAVARDFMVVKRNQHLSSTASGGRTQSQDLPKQRQLPAIAELEKSTLFRRLDSLCLGLSTHIRMFTKCVVCINEDSVVLDFIDKHHLEMSPLLTFFETLVTNANTQRHLYEEIFQQNQKFNQASNLVQSARQKDISTTMHAQDSLLPSSPLNVTQKESYRNFSNHITHMGRVEQLEHHTLLFMFQQRARDHGLTICTSSTSRGGDTEPRRHHILHDHLRKLDDCAELIIKWWHPVMPKRLNDDTVNANDQLSAWCASRLQFFMACSTKNIDSSLRALLTITPRVIVAAYEQIGAPFEVLQQLFQQYICMGVRSILTLALFRVLASNASSSNAVSLLFVLLRKHVPKLEHLSRTWENIKMLYANNLNKTLEQDIRDLVFQANRAWSRHFLSKMEFHRKVAELVTEFVHMQFSWIQRATIVAYCGVGSEELHSWWAYTSGNSIPSSEDNKNTSWQIVTIRNVAGCNILLAFDTSSKDQMLSTAHSFLDKSQNKNQKLSFATLLEEGHAFLTGSQHFVGGKHIPKQVQIVRPNEVDKANFNQCNEQESKMLTWLRVSLLTPLSQEEKDFFGLNNETAEIITPHTLQHAGHICSWARSRWFKSSSVFFKSVESSLGDNAIIKEEAMLHINCIFVLHQQHCLEQLVEIDNDNQKLPLVGKFHRLKCGSFNLYVNF